MNTNQHHTPSLQRALLANATFSTITSLALLSIPRYLGQLLGVANPLILQIVGFGLLLFALSLVYTARQKEINTQLVKLIIGLDALWVIGSSILLGLQLFSLTAIGYWAVAVIAIVVAGLGYWQYRSLPASSEYDLSHKKTDVGT